MVGVSVHELSKRFHPSGRSVRRKHGRVHHYPGRVIKTANEINGDITNFFEVLRDHEPELTRLLLLTPCSELEYNNSWEPSGDKIERARRFYVRIPAIILRVGSATEEQGLALYQATC